MAKLYNILRIVAYVSGLAGMVLFVTARQSAEPHAMRAAAGGILLIASFICFLGTYVIYVAVKLGRHGNK
jgi:hypothetical protein